MTEVAGALGPTAARPTYRLALLPGQPVRSGDVRLGSISDVFLTPDLGHVVGLELDGGQGRFVPWIAVARFGEGSGVDVGALAVLGASEHAYYAAHCLRLAELAADAPAREARVRLDGTLA